MKISSRSGACAHDWPQYHPCHCAVLKTCLLFVYISAMWSRVVFQSQISSHSQSDAVPIMIKSKHKLTFPETGNFYFFFFNPFSFFSFPFFFSFLFIYFFSCVFKGDAQRISKQCKEKCMSFSEQSPNCQSFRASVLQVPWLFLPSCASC